MSNLKIIALVLSLNGGYLVALFSFMGYRIWSGLSPVPDGYGPLVLGSSVAVAMGCSGLGNFLRQRRDRSQ